jgi:hypothetical protein
MTAPDVLSVGADRASAIPGPVASPPTPARPARFKRSPAIADVL